MSLSAGTLSGSGSIGSGSVALSSAAANTVVTPGSLTTPGNLTFNGSADFSGGVNYSWKLGSLSTSSPGVNWDLLTLLAGSLTLGGSSSLTLNFVNSINNPNNSGEAFWTTGGIHTWTITSGAGASANFGSISDPVFTDGTFKTSLSNGDVVLTYTPDSLGPRVLTWSDGASSPADTSGTWNGSVLWATGSGGRTFDSTRPDNAVFGAGAGTAGTGSGSSVTVTLSGTASANTFTFSSSSAQYLLTGGTLLVLSGGTANQSATIASNVVLNGSQTWDVTSGTLAANGGIGDGGSNSSLTKTGSGTLSLGGAVGAVSYTGSTTVNGGTLLLTANNVFSSYPTTMSFALANSAGVQFNVNGQQATIGGLSGGGTAGGTSPWAAADH